MAIAYSYPTVTPEATDLLVGTEITGAGEDAPRTRTFTIGSVVTLATTASALSAASLYATIGAVDLKANIESPTFTGAANFVGLTATSKVIGRVINPGVFTFATLPAPAVEGDTAIIRDASSTGLTYAANAAGGGTARRRVLYTGTAWIYA